MLASQKCVIWIRVKYCAHNCKPFSYNFRKHRPSYESIALTPRKYWSGSGPGWTGDAETNIPALLFPKHVLGLHASDDLAFHRDFEAVHSCSRRLNNTQASASNAYPDILNSNRTGKLLSYLYSNDQNSLNQRIFIDFGLNLIWKVWANCLKWKQKLDQNHLGTCIGVKMDLKRPE